MRRLLLAVAVLAIVWGTSHRAAAQAWTLDAVATEGELDAEALRAALETVRPELAGCAPGAGPYRFVFIMSVRRNGSVGEARAERGEPALMPARPARCIRHALLEVVFPEAAGTVRATLALGGSAEAPPPPSGGPAPTGPTGPTATGPTATGPTPTGPTASGPTASGPIGSGPTASGPIRSGPIATGPTATGPIATGPVATGAPRSTDITVGIPSSSDPGAAALRDAIIAARPSLIACYASALSADPSLRGEGSLHLTIDASGHVRRAMLATTEALASALATCIATAARSWTFAVSAEVNASIPLSFGTPGE
jgi:hypothetical protein